MEYNCVEQKVTEGCRSQITTQELRVKIQNEDIRHITEMETLQNRFEEDKITAAAIYGQEGQQQNTMTSIDVVSRKRQRKPEDPGSLGTIHSQQHNAEISKTILEKLQMKLQTYVTYIYYSSY